METGSLMADVDGTQNIKPAKIGWHQRSRVLDGQESPQSLVARKGSFIAAAFILSLAIPVFFNFGFIRMSPYRFIIIVTFFPMLIDWMSGKCGRVLAADFFLAAFCFWTVIATFANHGATQIQFTGIFFLETMGAYLLGRRYVRNLGDFLRVTKVLFWLLLLFIPFAFFEANLARQIYAPLFKVFGDTIPYAGYDPRWGMDRVQVAFDHPILYGIFCASTFSILFYRPFKTGGRVFGFRLAWASLAATFFSFSSGAYLPIIFQAGLMLYNRVMRAVHWRWWLFLAALAVMYVVIDLGSNRTPLQVFGSALAFSNSTYYWRVLIFQYGIENVWADPLFGFGLSPNWSRPSYMITSTVDNFWLVMAMRYGVPGFGLIFVTFLAMIVSLVRARVTIPATINQRNAMVFSLASIVVAITTVFLWNATLVFVMFLLGAGSWMTDIKAGDQPETSGGADRENLDDPEDHTDTSSLFKRPADQITPTAESAPIASQEYPQRRKYSRVEPRRSQHKRDHGEPD